MAFSSAPSPSGLDAAELAQFAGRPGVLLVDVRPRWHYRRAHVPGSHSIPAGLLLAGELPEGDLLLISGDSQDAEALIEQLHEQGYHRRIRYLVGGFASWWTGQSQGPVLTWQELFAYGRQVVGGPALLLAAGCTQSLGLLGLGLVVLLGPWALSRSRA